MKKITFPAQSGFFKELRSRIDNYFSENKISKSGNINTAIKSLIIVLLMAGSYAMLVFGGYSIGWVILFAFLLAQAITMVGFNIMHDGSHGSMVKSKRLSRLIGYSSELIGGSNLIWRQKHNFLHHIYTNIPDADNDLNTVSILRLSPTQKLSWIHKFQHLYAVGLYSLLSISWVMFDDIRDLVSGKIGDYKIKSKKRDKLIFAAGKGVYYGYMLVLPAFFHPFWKVALVFVGIHLVVGTTLAVVFQLAHVTEPTEFPEPAAKGEMAEEWALHQLRTTADFASKNKFLTWYLGGLNYQIEHHLFPEICHVHYPAISRIVRKTCQEYGVTYNSFPSFLTALRAHFKQLKDLGTYSAA